VLQRAEPGIDVQDVGPRVPIAPEGAADQVVSRGGDGPEEVVPEGVGGVDGNDGVAHGNRADAVVEEAVFVETAAADAEAKGTSVVGFGRDRVVDEGELPRVIEAAAEGPAGSVGSGGDVLGNRGVGDGERTGDVVVDTAAGYREGSRGVVGDGAAIDAH